MKKLTYAGCLEPFVEAMDAKLVENRYKGGWDSDSPHALLRRLIEETNELAGTLENPTPKEQIIREAADVANFAMMIADLARRDLMK